MGALAVIIPMFNEQANAERCVRTVCGVLRSSVPGARLFAVNDGSADDTLSILQRLATDEPLLEVVNCERNGGYGKACATGMQAAHDKNFEFGLVMDSDLTNDPALIPSFAEKLASQSFDVIKASRYIAGGGMEGVPAWRQAYTIVGNRIASLLFNMGTRDCTNGFHAVRLSMVAGEKFQERGFSFLLEELLLLKRKGARASEIPYILTSRASDEGVSKFSYKPKVLWAYLQYALRAPFVSGHKV